MASEIDDLTDKEKEALRLLLEGHDTKSSASKLDLSVHTINDRLRNARRKLGVSSSREAARILRDAEGNTSQATPKNTAHTSFGMEGEAAAPDTAILTQTKRAWPFRLTWLAGGMLIMSIVIAAAVLALVSGSGTTAETSTAPQTASTQSAAPSQSESPRDAESYAKAQRFLAEVDAGDWSGSWDVAGDFIQSQVSVEGWTDTVEPVRKPLGAVTSREFSSVQKTTVLPGAPEGDYEVLQFTTTFENREQTSVETVIMIRTDEGFDVAGFFIR